MQNKTRLELVDYEAENLAKLQKLLSRKWELIYMQAEAQIKVDKKRDKMERKILDSQERAFWDVYRPAPGCINTTEVDIKKTMRKRRVDHPNIGFFHSASSGSMKFQVMRQAATGTKSANESSPTNAETVMNGATNQPITNNPSNPQNNSNYTNSYQINSYLKLHGNFEEIISLENLNKEKDFLKRRLERRYVKTSKVQERYSLTGFIYIFPNHQMNCYF